MNDAKGFTPGWAYYLGDEEPELGDLPDLELSLANKDDAKGAKPFGKCVIEKQEYTVYKTVHAHYWAQRHWTDRA